MLSRRKCFNAVRLRGCALLSSPGVGRRSRVAKSPPPPALLSKHTGRVGQPATLKSAAPRSSSDTPPPAPSSAAPRPAAPPAPPPLLRELHPAPPPPPPPPAVEGNAAKIEIFGAFLLGLAAILTLLYCRRLQHKKALKTGGFTQYGGHDDGVLGTGVEIKPVEPETA
uniref:Uncharacterized protein n=1 Tax=Emiliania huxleyi TaxID=2903 RepID=A0A7S3RTG7_EMIHU